MKRYGDVFYASVAERSSGLAAFLAEEFSSFLHGSLVCDIGCGSGVFIEAFHGAGVKGAYGFDLPEALDTVPEKVKKNPANKLIAMDFEREVPELSGFGVSICLEVLEHLTESASLKILEALAESAPLIIFSAAQPGQGGTRHINERPTRYWLEKFDSLGFDVFDSVRPALIGNHSIPRFYQLNVFVLAKRGSSAQLRLSEEFVAIDPSYPHDFRTRMERIRFSLIALLPVRVVDLLSRIARY